MRIPFNRPYLTTENLRNLDSLIVAGKVGGREYLTHCSQYIKTLLASNSVFMTSSCTQALEFAAMALNISPGDEVILPSYTFVSSVLPFHNRGAIIKFVDHDPVTMNISVSSLEEMMTDKTKVVLVIHYGGLPCDIEKISKIVKKYNAFLIEDCAHSFGASIDGKLLGSWGDVSCFSFHHSKNLTCGEGGAIAFNNGLVAQDDYEEIYNKGTDYHRFTRKEVEFYEWVRSGSNYNMSEVNASLLYPSLKNYKNINESRGHIWKKYYSALLKYQERGILKIPEIKSNTIHAYHIFHFVMNDKYIAENLISFFVENGVSASRHYTPLHLTKQGEENIHNCSEKNESYKSMIRLPLFLGLTDSESNYIIALTDKFLHDKT